MPQNIIKVKQIDNAGLLSFVKTSLGITIASSTVEHTYNETFDEKLDVVKDFTVGKSSTFSGQSTFVSGFTSNSGIYVNGLVSGTSLKIDNFDLPSGTFQNTNIGNLILTGIPIYECNNAGVGALLPSGTVFGVKQTVNAPLFELDASGQLMPATGLGVSLVGLYVSVGH